VRVIRVFREISTRRHLGLVSGSEELNFVTTRGARLRNMPVIANPIEPLSIYPPSAPDPTNAQNPHPLLNFPRIALSIARSASAGRAEEPNPQLNSQSS
jgi:hypothetical protein